MVSDPAPDERSGVFDPSRHRRLDAPAWSPDVVRLEIADIIADFASAICPDASWPTHPFDGGGPESHWCQYDGAAGAVIAMEILARAGHAAPRLADRLPEIHAAYLRHPDHGYEPGLQLGEIGVLAPAMAAGTATPGMEARLERCMHDVLGHPAHETTSGETGMMHAALTLHRMTGQARWAAHYCAGANALFETWQPHGHAGEWHWRSDIFGSVRHYYGACHGVAGNAAALLRGTDLLPEQWVETTLERTAATLELGAIRDGDDLSWPVSADASGQRRLVQWCHGAGGVVAALGDAPRTGSAASTRLDALLEAAGETVWRAGPVAKGPGLCHGTAGNGLAFLALYRRTGAARWLERARAFAMHAIGQRKRGRARQGHGKYTLWTGDGGFAVYLDHCLEQQTAPAPSPLPGLELF